MAPTPDAPLTPLGRRLRAGRGRSGLSIRQAAKLAGLSHTAWNTLETGLRSNGEKVRGKPRVATVTAAARVVNLDPGRALRLAGWNPQHWLPADTDNGGPSADQRAVADRIKLLTGDRLDEVAAIVHRLLDVDTTTGNAANNDESGAA